MVLSFSIQKFSCENALCSSRSIKKEIDEFIAEKLVSSE